jgi:WD40 repeat protein
MRVFDWGRKQRQFSTVAFDRTGQLLAAGGWYHGTVVWDVATGAERARLAVIGRALQFHPRTDRLVVESSAIQVCDVNTGAVVPAVSSDKYSALVTFAPDADWAVYYRTPEGKPSVLAAVTGFGEPGHTVLWEVNLGDTAEESGHSSCLECLSDGERFLSAEQISVGGSYLGSRRRIAIRSRINGRLLQESTKKLIGYGDSVYAAPVSDQFIVQDGMWLRVHRINDLNAPPRVIRNDNKKHFTGVAFHPSGKYLAATSNDATVKLYDTSTWEVVRAFTWDIGRMRSICFAPDGTIAAAGGDKGKVVVWDVDL